MLHHAPSYGDAFAAQVFKISSDEKGSRLTHLKITGGALHVRDAISYTTESGTVCTEKVSQIRCYSGTKFQTVETIPAGAVCTVTGLSRTFCGQGLGASENSTHPVLEPVMSYALQFPAAPISTQRCKSCFRWRRKNRPCTLSGTSRFRRYRCSSWVPCRKRF